MAINLTRSELDDLAEGGSKAAQVIADLRTQLEALSAVSEAQRTALQGQINVLNDYISTEAKRAAMGAEQEAKTREQIRLLNELKTSIFSLSAAYTDQQNRIRGLMGINDAWKTSTTGVMAKIMAEGEGVSAAFASITSQMAGVVSRTEMVTSSFMKLEELGTAGMTAIVSQTIKLATSVDQAQVSLARATGASQRFTSMIPDMEQRLFKLGISAENAAAAVGSLFSGMTGFTQMAAGTRAAVADSVAALERMGISSDVSARNLDIMNRSMGMSGQQAMAMNEQLFSAAQNLGISTSKMLGDFGSIGPQLIKFGQEATRVYINLQSVAKNTGVEISRLLSITEQFDKFDTAAESVGRLNAILGGPYLNTIQMVMSTDPTQRLQMMTRAVKDAGMNFDSMSYYMRQATASAMGLQDVNELAMLMRGRIDLLGSSTMKSSRDIEKMMVETQRFNTIAEEMQQALRTLAFIMEPFIIKLKEGLQFLQENQYAVRALVGAFAGLKVLSTVTTGIAMTSAALKAFGFAATGASVSLAPLIAAGVGIAAMTALFYGVSPAADGATASMNRFSASTQTLAAQAEGARIASREMANLAMTVDAVPDTKVVNFTHLLDKTAQAGRVQNAGAGIVQNQAAAMYRSPAPQVQVRQPIKVALEMDSRSIGSQVVDVMMS